MSESQQYQNKEFLWFSMENKLRALVFELIQPVNKRIHEERLLAQNLRREFNEDHKLLQDISSIVFSGKSPEELPIFKKIISEVNEVEQSMINLREENAILFKRAGTRLDEMNSLKEDCSRLLSASEKQYNEVREDFVQHKLTVTNVCQRQLSEFKRLEEGLLKRMKDTSLSIKKLEVAGKTMEDQAVVVDQRLNSLEETLTQTKARTAENQGQIAKLAETLKEQALQITTVKKELEVTTRLNASIGNFKEELGKIEDFVSTILPLHVQAQVNDAAEVIARGSARKRYQVFKSRRLQQYSDLLLRSTGSTKLPSKHDYQQMLHEQTVQNYHEVTRLKIEKLLARGVQIHKLQSEEREFELDRCELRVEDYEDESSSSKAQSLSAETQQILRSLNRELNQSIGQLRGKVECELTDGKAYIQGLGEELRYRCLRHEEDVGRRVEGLRKDLLPLELRLKGTEELLEDIRNCSLLSEEKVELAQRHVSGLMKNDTYLLHRLNELSREQTRLRETKDVLTIDDGKGRPFQTMDLRSRDSSREVRPRTVRTSLNSRRTRAQSRGEESGVSTAYVFQMKRR